MVQPAALLLLFCSVSSFAAEYFRAFHDHRGNFITVHGNSVAWGDGKIFHPLPTGKFKATPTFLHFSFDDESGNFDVTSAKPVLTCAQKSRVYTELTSHEALYMRAHSHFQPATSPAKPVLLGLLSGTQLFLYVEATRIGQGYPRFQLYFGPVRQLKALPTAATSGVRETVITARDLRIVVAPGSQGSGVLIHYQKKSYPLDYLRNSPDNLVAVLGDALYRKIFEQKERKICDSVLGSDQ